MKTITAKDFQLQHAAILKQVAAGAEYEVTFHRRPVAHIVPAGKPKKKFIPGSKQAVLDAFKYSIQSSGDLHDRPFKELRDKMVQEEYGPFDE